MQNIVISSHALNLRGTKVQKLLRHISFDRQNGPAYSHVKLRERHVIGFHGSQFRFSENYRDWRFKTRVPSIYAMYFEQWMPLETGKHGCWYLDRAYLNLYELSDRRFMDSLKEFVCLHCDPNEPDGDAHSYYKRVPHIHIKAAREPIPRAHISLNLDYSDKVLNSVDTLFSSWQTAIFMLRDEILDRMLQ
jgi:hypothetical protein